LSNDGVVVSNIELVLPINIFLNSNGSYDFSIKIPTWGFLLSYCKRFQKKLFYLYYYKCFLVKTILQNTKYDDIYYKRFYSLSRRSFFNLSDLMIY
jgi:hypothetical protein